MKFYVQLKGYLRELIVFILVDHLSYQKKAFRGKGRQKWTFPVSRFLVLLKKMFWRYVSVMKICPLNENILE